MMQKAIVALPSTLIYLVLAGVVFILSGPLLGSDSDPIFRWLLAAGVITLAYYGFDKARSKGNARRIPEWTLHGLALSGGVVGSWLGVFLFRHKTQKPVFRLILLVATALWAWLLWR